MQLYRWLQIVFTVDDLHAVVKCVKILIRAPIGGLLVDFAMLTVDININ